jgi:hypothetical protein
MAGLLMPELAGKGLGMCAFGIGVARFAGYHGIPSTLSLFACGMGNAFGRFGRR